MSRETSEPRVRTASHALVSAALGGLLCLGTACSSSNNTHSNPSSGGSGGASTGGTGGGATGGSGGTVTGGSGGSGMAGSGGSATGGAGGSATGGTGGVSTGGTAGTGGSVTDAGADASTDAASDASDAAAPVYCSNAPDAGTVTSSVTIAMTQAQFQSLCLSNGGTFEIMPHCGGFNTCMGFSYDAGSQVLSQHTCRGLNTCGGYSCVVCGDAGTP